MHSDTTVTAGDVQRGTRTGSETPDDAVTAHQRCERTRAPQPPGPRPPQSLSARARDEQRYHASLPPSAAYLRHAHRWSGRSPVSLAFEYLRLHRGRGKLTLPEYVQYGLYDPALAEDEKSRFLSETLHWPITWRCCDFTWQAITEDKWLFSRLLERSSIPVPPVLAVIDASARSYPDTRTIRTPAELKDFVLAHTVDGEAVFGKVNLGVASFGAFLITGGERNRLQVHADGWMDYGTFLGELVADTPYLLQARERNHPVFDRWTEHLATVRLYLLLGKRGGGAHIPFAVLKLPSSDNIADNFWRPGNLVCALDPERGAILKARTKDAFGTTDHDEHPATGAPLVGETLPMWDRVLDLAQACAPIFAPIRYQSMDIAITPAGPMLIEINTGGSFTLAQFASGRGFLTDEVREFFRECGYAKV